MGAPLPIELEDIVNGVAVGFTYLPHRGPSRVREHTLVDSGAGEKELKHLVVMNLRSEVPHVVPQMSHLFGDLVGKGDGDGPIAVTGGNVPVKKKIPLFGCIKKSFPIC